MTACLCDNGIPAEFIDLSKLVSTFSASSTSTTTTTTLEQPFYDSIVKSLSALLAAPHGPGPTPVPVITGFFGPVPGSLLKQIGRGYTDLTAALVAVAVDASELHIYKVNWRSKECLLFKKR